MRTTSILGILLLALSCSYTNNDKHQTKNVNSSKPAKKRIFSVEKPSLYSTVFLDSLKNSHYSDTISLKKDMIIIGRDTVRFPKYPQMDHKYTYQSEKDSTKYVLTVSRINLTDIQYNYTIKKGDSTLKENSGKASLNPMFFLGSESPDDDQSGEGYEAFEYIDDKQSCSVWIGIGMDPDDKKRLRAYIKDRCKDKNSLSVPDGLTLRSKEF